MKNWKITQEDFCCAQYLLAQITNYQAITRNTLTFLSLSLFSPNDKKSHQHSRVHVTREIMQTPSIFISEKFENENNNFIVLFRNVLPRKKRSGFRFTNMAKVEAAISNSDMIFLREKAKPLSAVEILFKIAFKRLKQKWFFHRHNPTTIEAEMERIFEISS